MFAENIPRSDLLAQQRRQRSQTIMRVEVRADRRRLHEIFTHTLLLPMLGLPLGEMWNLEALAADCAADGRYECMFTSAPLNLPHGVASPPNALAMK